MISADTMIGIARRLESMSHDACLGHNDVHMTPQAVDVLAKSIKDYVREPERPTCHLVGTTSEDCFYGPTIFSYELSCGHTCDSCYPEPPVYCNECGCRVVEKEKDDDLR